MDHAGAIASFVVPLLLALLCGLASYGLHMHKQFISRNEREHEKLATLEANHEQRLTRAETKIEYLEAEYDRNQ